MKRTSLLIFGLVQTFLLFSQKQHFLYIQSEPSQPFIVRLGETIHTSSSSGYLILSRLADSNYSLSISFPQNKWPAQVFSITVKGADLGLALRYGADRGWALYDFAGSGVYTGKVATSTPVENPSPDASAFAVMLAKVANDPSLKEKPAVREDKEKGVSSAPVVKKEADVAANEDKVVIADPPKKPEAAGAKIPNDSAATAVVEQMPATVPAKQDRNAKIDSAVIVANPPKQTRPESPKPPVSDTKKEENKGKAAGEAFRPNQVTRQSEENRPQGLVITYVDEYPGGRKDTVRILIPPGTVVIQPPVQDTTGEKRKFLDIPVADSGTKGEGGVFSVKTSSCQVIADEDDFLKLRKRMAAARGDEAMIGEARKAFKTRCYSTMQLRNLGSLFLNEEGRYRFFDAAYGHVSDPDQFATLASELNDPYFLNRFKAILH